MVILMKQRYGWREVDLAERMAAIADHCESNKCWSGFPHNVWLKSEADFVAAEAFITTYVRHFTSRIVSFHRFVETSEGVPRLMFCVAWHYYH
ncbi:hypothetical protein HWC07_gp016 [Pantoea phage vB_PagM_LIET2]|uniref:Uncharacterized protein n=1 Tax=Pantoea phage vB_PagM_LIET2 TaxID=2508071 RepID=A0A411AVZ8_9CAUD|nr:hypothetical protein HWC07_gp016 [Pantoea phage vB_PagM_LIET2]QAX92268.1 hypothetical protein LIET2_gp016 [Pantoea phage vB_PagM_LIET2]